MIIVHAKGNEKIGIGNLSRANEIVKYLNKTQQAIGIFECDKELFKRYKNKHTFLSKDMQNSLELMKKYKQIVYISDLVSPSKELSDTLRKMDVKKIFHFNDLLGGFEPDVLFVTDGFDYEVNYEDIKIYRGFKYYVVGENITKKRPEQFKTISKIQKVLVSFGGADPAFFTEYFAKAINDTKYNYTFVLGPAMSKQRKQDIQNIKKENINYIDSPTNMSELLLSHDILVTLGGMSTYEAMCLGTPACAIRWNYLEYIVKSFGEKNMINDLGNIEQSYLELLNINIDDVNKRAKNAFNIIDGNSLRHIETAINENL